MFQIDKNKCLWLKKLKMLCRGHMLLVILTVKKKCWKVLRKKIAKSKSKNV